MPSILKTGPADLLRGTPGDTWSEPQGMSAASPSEFSKTARVHSGRCRWDMGDDARLWMEGNASAGTPTSESIAVFDGGGFSPCRRSRSDACPAVGPHRR